MCLGHGSIGRRGNVSYTEGCFLYAFGLKKKCTPTEAELLLGIRVPTDIRFVSNFDNKAYIFFIRFFAFLLLRLLEIIVRVAPNSFVFFHKYLKR